MLNKMGQKPETTFDKLYAKLYNKKLWLYAYQRVYAKPGNMTPGTDGKTIDGTSEAKIDRIIMELKASRYKPNPVRRVHIPKSNGSQRPLGIPCWEDKLLQVVIKLILEAIYEPKFLTVSHGFRPNRSCHTALEAVTKMNGTRWWVEGDIKGCFDNIDHEILITILGKVITDKRFLHLIEQLLKVGYVEEWEYHQSYSGTPQGGNLSPILSNIYLHELDKAASGYVKFFKKGDKRAKDQEWKRVLNRRYRAKKRAQQSGDWTLYREQGNQLRNIKAMREQDADFRRMYYVRYADDFLIGINSSKQDAEEVKNWLRIFLQDALKLELSETKTLITNSKDKVRFLGYEIQRWGGNKIVTQSDGKRQRVATHNLGLFIPKDKVHEFVQRYGNSHQWQGQARTPLFNNSELEILLTYNAELRGFLNYYILAHNFSQIGGAIIHMANDSFFKTVAAKRQSSRAKVMKSMKKSPGDYRLRINVKGEPREYRLVSGTKQFKEQRIKSAELDKIPNTIQYYDYTEIGQRLNAHQCEWCGTEGKVEVHHVRKLKDLNGKQEWEKVMIARRRKTLVMCHSCHDKLHAGKLQPMKIS